MKNYKITFSVGSLKVTFRLSTSMSYNSICNLEAFIIKYIYEMFEIHVEHVDSIELLDGVPVLCE